MKNFKNIFRIGFLFILLLVLVGCPSGTKPPVIITPTEKAPVIDLSISPTGVIDYDGSFTATWNIVNFGSGTLNGEAISASGSRTFDNVIENISISIFAKNIQKTATKDMTVNVGEEATPTITVTVTPEGITPYHDTVTISWTSTDANTVTIDGVEVELNGSQEFNNLIIGQDVTIVATNDTKTASETITIEVGDWTSSVWGMINHEYWRNTEDYLISHDPINGDSTHPTDLNAEDLARQWFFQDDGLIHFFNPDGNIPLGTSQWRLSEDYTKLIRGEEGESETWDIKEITPVIIKISKELTWNSLPATKWMVFER